MITPIRPAGLPFALFALVLVLFAAMPSGRAALIVVPNSQASAEGNSADSVPFTIGDFNIETMRYQQLYTAANFSSINPGGSLITQILFRLDKDVGRSFSTTIPSIRIDLSTTSVADDALSPFFASNVGANNATVFGGATGAPLTISSSFTDPGVGPKPFDIVINLTTPFFYNPALGNLLMDVRIFDSESTSPFDSVNTTGDGVSRALTFTTFDVNSPAAEITDTAGLVTAFTVVPEPCTGLLLLVSGALALAISRRGRAPRRVV